MSYGEWASSTNISWTMNVQQSSLVKSCHLFWTCTQTELLDRCPVSTIYFQATMYQNITVFALLISTGFSMCIVYVWHAGGTAYSFAYFGKGTGGIFLDNLYCTGRELRLVDCYHNGIGVHNCDHSADAGLRCLGILHLKITLVWR